MLFVDDENPVIGKSQFKHCNALIFHELRRNQAANQVGKLPAAVKVILLCLNGSKLVASSFCLHGNDILRSVPVQANVNLVDFQLSDFFHVCTQMILKRISGDAEENIDQTVVAGLAPAEPARRRARIWR